MHTRTVHDMRLLEREDADGTKRYVLERVRTKPYDIRATWRTNEFGSLRVALDDALAEGFPARGGRTENGTVLLDHDGAHQKRGTIQARLRNEQRAIDVEVSFDLPVER